MKDRLELCSACSHHNKSRGCELEKSFGAFVKNNGTSDQFKSVVDGNPIFNVCPNKAAIIQDSKIENAPTEKPHPVSTSMKHSYRDRI